MSVWRTKYWSWSKSFVSMLRTFSITAALNVSETAYVDCGLEAELAWCRPTALTCCITCELPASCVTATAHDVPTRNDTEASVQWRRQGGGEGGKLPPYGWTSKNYVICVRFHCHGASSYHTTNTLQGRRAKSHVDTQTIQPGLGDFVL